MVDNTSVLAVVGPRLRSERERLGLGQVELGIAGGVTRQSQSEYESGKRPFNVSYLIALMERKVDVMYVLTGKRSVQTLGEAQAAVVAHFDAMTPDDRNALLRVAGAMSGRPAPAPIKRLPSIEALSEAIGGFLEATPGLAGDALAHELAKRLPTILRSAEDEIVSPLSDQADAPPAYQAGRDDDRRAAQPGRRI